MLLNKFVDPQLNLNFIITVKNSLETLTLTLSIIKYSKSKLSRDWNFVILTLRRKKLKVSVYIIFWIIFVINMLLVDVEDGWVECAVVCSLLSPPGLRYKIHLLSVVTPAPSQQCSQNLLVHHHLSHASTFIRNM